MSTNRLPAASYAGHREFTTLAMLLTPLLTMVVLFAVGIVMEIRAESEVEKLLLQHRGEGLRTSQHALIVAFDQRTSRDHADRWRDALLASSELVNRFFQLKEAIGDQDDHLVGPGEPWEAGPLMTQFANEAAPTIALVERLVQDPNPFWRPLMIDGISISLPDLHKSRSFARILTAEFRVAVHQGDHDRALRALRLILDVSNAFDWEVALVGETIRIAIIGQHRSMIQESLAIGFWQDAEHLSELREQLSRRDDLDERWKRVANAETGMLFSELFGDPEADQQQRNDPGDLVKLFPFKVSPSLKLQFLKQLPYRHDFSGAGTNQYLKRIDREEQQREESLIGSNASSLVAVPYGIWGFLANQFLVSESYYASAFTRFEFNRKIILTAVAIKQFQVKENRWPEKLNELSAVGLSASQWSVEPGVPIGYQISDDRSSVNLWANTDKTHILFVPVEPTTKKGPSVETIWIVTIK